MQETRFCAPNLCSGAWLVKGATQFSTSKNERNKLDLTADQYFSLVDHNDWSRWFAISSPTYMQIQFYWSGCPKNNSETYTYQFIIQSDILSTRGDAMRAMNSILYVLEPFAWRRPICQAHVPTIGICWYSMQWCLLVPVSRLRISFHYLSQ